MKGPKPPKIVVVLIVTTITIIFWVFLSVYEVLRKTPDLNIPDAVLKPLTPSLDQTSLGELPARVFYSEEELKNIIPQTITTPTPLETTPEQASPSPTLVSTTTSSASATPTP